MKYIYHTIVFITLSLSTQVGGIIYFITILVVRSRTNRILKRLLFFLGLYAVSLFVIVPHVAKYFGRMQVENDSNLQSHSFFYKVCFRNYVTPELNSLLVNLSKEVKIINKDIKVIYLDANFPLIDGFPLLPHLSHNDGRKIDISFIYKTQEGKFSNLKKSISGYGVFVEPEENEINQTELCKKQGSWYYDYTKYFTFGSVNSELEFSEQANKVLIEKILKEPKLGKLFIEPHLKHRLKINHPKVRFQGCHAVRHDDHIHIQL